MFIQYHVVLDVGLKLNKVCSPCWGMTGLFIERAIPSSWTLLDLCHWSEVENMWGKKALLFILFGYIALFFLRYIGYLCSGWISNTSPWHDLWHDESKWNLFDEFEVSIIFSVWWCFCLESRLLWFFCKSVSFIVLCSFCEKQNLSWSWKSYIF